MAPDQQDQPATTPLDAEREALRRSGYTEAEVSQILITRAASQQPAGAPSQGVMSNVLSSLVAVASHARAVIPSFRKDVATVFDGAATASARAGATASLAVKAVVILVLGYAAWQEWNQHIISATETARSEAIIKHQQACAAKFSFSSDKGVSLSPDCQASQADVAVGASNGTTAPATTAKQIEKPTCKINSGTSAQRGDCTQEWADYYAAQKRKTP
jgi:hypothetical protein